MNEAMDQQCAMGPLGDLNFHIDLAFFFFRLVPPAGHDPATFGLKVRYSAHLSYGGIFYRLVNP